MRAAEARCKASTVTSNSIRLLLVGAQVGCTTKTSRPRTFSVISTIISPSLNSLIVDLPRCRRNLLAISCASGGLALPEYFEFAGTHIRGPASDFELQRLDGENIASKDLKGKVILLDFWDTHGGPCRKLMPEMEKLQAKYEGDSRVVILVVNAGWEPFEAAKKYVSENDYTLAFAYDPDAQVSQSMRVWELPTTILIDTDFNYHSKHIAYEPGQEAAIVEHYGALIEEMLAEAG